jgi:anaerobic carbon-monoxide dehydrogenase iron sulfur subunit
VKLFFDPNEVCVGCHLCEAACSRAHFGVFNPRRSLIRIVTIEPGMDRAAFCHQCRGVPCGKRCPTQAISYDTKVGLATIARDDCIGCGVCVEDCPFGVITVDREAGVAVKCDTCDGNPACIPHCPTGVLKLKSSDQVAQAKRIAQVVSVENTGGRQTGGGNV